MKKVILALAVVSFGFAACNNEGDKPAEEAKKDSVVEAPKPADSNAVKPADSNAVKPADSTAAKK